MRASDPRGNSSAGAVVIQLASVEPQHVSWLWRSRVPKGKLTVLDGDPGLGKSTVALDLAARLTTGTPMPGSGVRLSPANVLVASAEDGLADTIQPRLAAAGADLGRVGAIAANGDGGLLNFPHDCEALEQAVVDHEAALVVIDPLAAYLGGDINSHRDQDVRRALAPLSKVAERTEAAVLVIRHLNKTASTHALYRGGGSIGIIGAARAGLLVGIDPDDPSRRILAVSKSNLGPMPPALAYRLTATGDVARVEWLGATKHTASSLLSMPEPTGTSRDETAEWLLEVLADEDKEARYVEWLAKGAGISQRTLERAKKAAGVRSTRKGFGPDAKWFWAIDRHTPPTV